MKRNNGTTLIELLLYTAILGTVLLVIYSLFVQSSLSRMTSYDSSKLFLNSRAIIFDLEHSIHAAGSVNSPALGSSGNSLNLDNGSIIYQVNNGGILTKNENGQINNLTTGDVYVQSLVFSLSGPSNKQPTVGISFILATNNQPPGNTKQESFQTSVSLR